MLKSFFEKTKQEYNIKKEENATYNQLLGTTTTFKNLFPITTTTEPTEYKIAYITNDCPDINKEKAQIIASLIPIDETYLSVIYSKEILTNQEYYLIPTNKYFWIINTKNFGALPYQNQTCQIIKNNLMSKTLLLNNILLEVTGNNTKIEKFINIITNDTYRNQLIQEKTAYLCNLIPIYQKINSIGSGISIDNQKNIVFHTQNRNYKYNIEEIENFEVLLDNQVYISKNSQTSKAIGNFKSDCYQISIRITTKEQQILSIPILEPNTFGTKYTTQDSIFKKNITFATDIINKLNELSPKY